MGIDLSNLASSRARAEDLIALVVRNVMSEIHSMKGVLGRSANVVDFVNLEKSAIASLTSIKRLIVEGWIEPLIGIRHSLECGLPARQGREVRIGVFPTAANPLHWAHLLGGLVVMERFHLDKVIFVIAGQDSRKPEMAPAKVRHSMAKEVLHLFNPFFEYSPIALGTTSSGEENLFKILKMNPAQAIHAFYIAGGDHYHRFDPASGSPDTIQRLEEGMAVKSFGFDARLHRVSPVFLHRVNEERVIPTFLDVHRVGTLPLQTSSTEIRWALEDRGRWGKLSALPYVALASICGNGLYRVGECKEFLDTLHSSSGRVVDSQDVTLEPGHARRPSFVRSLVTLPFAALPAPNAANNQSPT